MYTVANNMFLNMVKHEKVVIAHTKSIQKDKTNESPEFILLEKEFMEKLEETIANLQDKLREVFCSYFI